MKTVPLKDDMWRVFTDTTEYIRLLDSAYEPPSRSVRSVRLEMRIMACSLRVDTTSGLTYGQFVKRKTPEGDLWFAAIRAKDATEREAETRPRMVYIPDDIMEQIHRHAERHNIGEEDELFECSKRTIQRDVKRSAKNAATATGNEDFKKISSHDLRRYFATHLLYRHQVPPPVVRGLGGWKSDEAMFEYLVLPNDVLAERLGESGLLGTSYDKLRRDDLPSKISSTTDRLDELIESADRDDIDSVESKVVETVSKIQGISVDSESINKRSEDENDTDETTGRESEEITQTSLSQITQDEQAALEPISPVVGERISEEWDGCKSIIEARGGDPRKRLGMVAAALPMMSLSGGLSWGMDLAKMYKTDPHGTVALSAIGILLLSAFLLADLHNEYHEDPQDVEVQSLFDRLAVESHRFLYPVVSWIGRTTPNWM